MKKLLLFTLLLLPKLLLGQFGSEEIITQCTYCHFGTVDAADIDGDGDMDFLSNFGPNYRIVWHENDGKGQFATPKSINVQASRYKWIHDLDGDGVLDVLVSSLGITRLAWYKNNGTGSFGNTQIIYESDDFIDVNPFDVDNDGDIDLVISIRSENVITWYENDSYGNFSQGQIIKELDRFVIGQLHIEDLNNDGLLDIIFEDPNRIRVTWMQNLGEGIFSEEAPIIEDEVEEVRLFDVDGDGDIDLVAGINKDRFSPDIYPNNKESTLFWYENDGSGLFSNKKIIDHLIYVKKIFSANLDNKDGLDIIVITLSSVYWYKNDGKGNFIIQEELPDWVNKSNLIQFQDSNLSVASADFDGDTTIDLLIVEPNIDALVLYNNVGNDRFTSNILYKELISSISAIEVGDIDNNQSKDIITFHDKDKEIIGFLNYKKNNISVPKVLVSDTEPLHSIATGDLDKNGTLDIITSSYNKEAHWYQNDGSGNFSKQKIISDLSDNTTIIAVVDMDGDEEEDIVWRSAFKLFWSKNMGAGRSFTHKIIDNQGLSTTIFDGYKVPTTLVTDFDGDGDIDIVSKDLGRELIWYKNDGQGDFDITQSPIAGNNSYSFTSIDVDGDKQSEILVAEAGTIILIKNTGVGTPTREILSSSVLNISTIYQLQAIDLDKDGDMDIVTSVYTGTTGLYWLENDGIGNFTEQGIPNAASRLRNKFIGSVIEDLNRDGYPDIVGISAYNARIVWFENIVHLPGISGKTFWDVNANGQVDETEKGIPYVPLNISPTSEKSYTNNNGDYRLYMPTGIYTVTTDTSDCWEPTTDKSYTIPINDKTRVEGKNFGFQLVSDYMDSNSRVNSSPTRCGFKVAFWLTIVNTGCQPIRGRMGLVLDSLVTFISASRDPSEVQGDTLFWDYDELLAGQSEQVRLVLEIAGPDHIGEFIQMTALSYIEDEKGELVLVDAVQYRSEIRCAYDPNDKIPYPDRSLDYDQNYTLFEEDLEYTIRFQNTGNDTAFTVVIKDQLDKNLDWTSFQPLTSSHPHETLLHKDGLVEFSFRNILLPDSTTNEIASHGFVTYKIAPKKGLPENTNIQNTAGIYFDFNPPILTNTTSNVLVSELPKQLVSVHDVVAPQKVKVYPNPFGDYILFERLDPSLTDTYRVLLFDSTGKQVRENQMKDSSHQLAVDDLVTGIFFYQVIAASGEVVARGKVVKGR